MSEKYLEVELEVEREGVSRWHPALRFKQLGVQGSLNRGRVLDVERGKGNVLLEYRFGDLNKDQNKIHTH